MLKTRVFLIAASFLALALYGCGKPVETEHESAYYKELGDDYFGEKNYKSAINSYENALMRAESPEDASLIQLSLGNSYFLSKKYADAIPVYEVYLDYYGDTPAANMAILRIGLAHFHLMRRPPQDQTQTVTALKYFEQIMQRDPALAAEYEIENKIRDIRQRLAEKEYIIGRYYGRILEYRPSMLRYKYLADNYPESKRYEIACYKLIKLLIRFGDISEAENYFALLKIKYPDSKYIDKVNEAFRKKAQEEAKAEAKKKKKEE